jgi:peptide deformylase
MFNDISTVGWRADVVADEKLADQLKEKLTEENGIGLAALG